MPLLMRRTKLGKIFYIFGKSATGKDTIFKKILEQYKAQFQVIIPYTTRPVRDGETEGVEYHFVKEEKLLQLEAEGKVIEQRTYHTIYGIWKYFTVDDGQFDLEKNNYLMIGVLESYQRTKAFFGAGYMVPIYVDLEDGVRLQRALDREKTQDTPKYEELCRRFLADSEDFAEDKLKQAGIKERFYNNHLQECLKEIGQYIQDKMQ